MHPNKLQNEARNIPLLAFIFFGIIFSSFIISFHLPQGVLLMRVIFFLVFTGIFLLIASVHCYAGARIPFGKMDLPFFLFIIYILIHDLTNAPGNLFNMAVLMDIAILLLYYPVKWLGSRICEKHISLFAFILTFALLLHLIVGTLQMMHAFPSLNPSFTLTGMFSNPAAYGMYICVLLVFNVNLVITSLKLCKYPFISWLLLALQLWGIVLLIFSASRTCWMGYSIIVCLTIILRFNIRFIKIPKILKYVLFPVILAASLNGLFNYKEKSALGRLLIWEVSAQVAIQSPLTGIGNNYFANEYMQAQSRYFKQHPGSAYRYIAGETQTAFNEPLEMFCKFGIVGLLLFIMAVAAILYVSRVLLSCCKQEDDFTYSILCGTIGMIMFILIAGLFSYPFSVLPIAVIFWCAFPLLIQAYERKKNAFRPLRDFNMIFSLVYIFWGSVFIYCGLQRYHALKFWNELKINGQYGVIDLMKINTALSDNPKYLLELGSAYLEEKEVERAITILERGKLLSASKRFSYKLAIAYEQQGNFDKAREEYEFLTYAIPGLITPHFQLAKFYYRTCREKEFIAKANEVLAFQPKISSAEVEKIKSQMHLLLSSYELYGWPSREE